MNKIIGTFVTVVTAAVLVSCAVQKGTDDIAMEEAALAGWMRNNRPDIPKMEDGLYYKIYPAGTDAKKVSLTDGVSWIYLTGLGTDLEGNYFFNMYGDIARRLGTYTELTHFVPEIYRYIESQDLTSGVYKVLPEMSVGDSIEMYCSSRWGYGSGTAEVYVTGFEGNIDLSGNTPIYRTFRLNNASDDPAEISEKEVTEYATDKLDKLVSDSLKKGVYLRITQPVAKGETIGEEDEVEVFYTGRYIDGKVFDTNIEKVARENKIYDSEKSYKAMSVKGNSDSFVKGFMLAVTNMKRGEKGTVVFTYNWGYGVTGNNSDGIYIRPFDSLVFDIEILEEEDD